jgi:hypothetical protein
LLHSRHIILILSQQVFARTLTCCFTQDTLYWFWVNKSLLVPFNAARDATYTFLLYFILPYQGLKPWSTALEWARWFYLTRDWNHDLLHSSEHADFTLPGIETMIYCTRVSTLTSPMWFQISHTIKYCLIFGNGFQDYLDNWISHF